MFDKLAFSNAYTDAPDIVLQPFVYEDLLCPDGEPATFYAVYREGLDEPAEFVVVYHAGAFDYVRSPDPTIDPLAGAHYAGENRMTSEWASGKVFETLGLHKTDASSTEVNDGTLAAVLADRGTFALYPANCWGDLWRSESGYQPNDWGEDGGVHREGRFMAWMMTRFVSTDTEEAADWRSRFGLDALPIPLDSSGMYFIGLGEGGRALPELLRRTDADQAADASFPPVLGAILDSPMDDVTPIAQDPAGWPDEHEGINRLFPDETDWGRYSMNRLLTQNRFPNPLTLYWSSADPQVPDETLAGLVGQDAAVANLVTIDTGEPVHVNLNRDITLARTAIETLIPND